ncbi:MAG: NAD-dependent epimerase/dehydratase family protein [Anaerolineae bacterium]|nr:NAD-dependent epimerase/dehydratase family protein [Anaerolineae bacterium]
MHILIVGGTQFVGRHLVEAAHSHGHQLTLFNRGRTNPDLYPYVEKVHGDRANAADVGRLHGRRFDAVIDTCGYFPRAVSLVADALVGTVERYAFISTLSVFRDNEKPGQTETSELATLADESTEQVTGETYGGLKVLCERAAEAAFPGRTLVIRPGLIVGPHDPTNRLPYWVDRVARGGEALAPGTPDQPVQFIDARDLAEFTIRLLENGAADIFNATGPDYPLTLGKVLDTCRDVSGSDARFVWLDEAFLLSHDVQPWADLPLWLPAASAGFSQFDVSKALRAGLRFRPLDATIRDTLDWLRGLDDEQRTRLMARGEGMSASREAELLAAWRHRAHNERPDRPVV